MALVVRLGHLWLLQDSPLSYVLMGDARRYHEWGAEIAAGNWLGTQSFYQAPLYAYFIGGLYSAFGIDQAVVRIAQSVLGASSCVLLAIAGRARSPLLRRRPPTLPLVRVSSRRLRLPIRAVASKGVAVSRLWWELRWQVRLLGHAVFAASRAPRRVAPQRSAVKRPRVR